MPCDQTDIDEIWRELRIVQLQLVGLQTAVESLMKQLHEKKASPISGLTGEARAEKIRRLEYTLTREWAEKFEDISTKLEGGNDAV